MKKSKLIVMIVFLFGNLVFGQGEDEWNEETQEDRRKSSPAIQTLANEVVLGGYGGPEVRVTEFADKWGVMVGARGGFLIGRTFTIGLLGAGFANSVDRDYTEEGSTESTVLKMGYGGLFLEYVWDLPRLVHFSIPLDLVAVGVSSDKDDDEHMDRTAWFAVIPRLNVEFNVTRFLMVALSGGYRFAFGESKSYLDQWDLWGPEVGILFKFGKF